MSAEKNEVDDVWRRLQSLYSDISEGEHFPQVKPLLAHYTSIDTVDSMLRSNELWFSNPLLMNDVDELRFGLNEGASRFFSSTVLKSALRPRQYEILTKHFKMYMDEFVNKSILDAYAFCFSKHDRAEDADGRLSMWRGYGKGGNGAAIVIDTAKLENLPSSAFIIAPIRYGSRQQRLDWIDGKLVEFSTLLGDLSLEDDQLYLAANAFFERLKVFSIFTKHKGFSEEKEWRVAYIGSRDKKRQIASMFDYAIGSRGVEPKLKLKLEPVEGQMQDGISLVNLVDQIILGPSVSSPLSKAAFERMLEKNKLQALIDKVSASSIPFRP